MRFRVPSPLYAMADTLDRPELSYPAVAEQLCTGGARLLQLRVKRRPSRDFLSDAVEVGRICRRHGATFLVNDRVDVALAAEAAGVHLGQNDLPLPAARSLCGPEKIIGVSTHSLAQALAAQAAGADYVGFGPLFGTTSKATGYPPRGLDRLAEVCDRLTIPVVAIGGITTARAPAALAAGAAAVAMIGELVSAPDVARRTADVLAALAAPSPS